MEEDARNKYKRRGLLPGHRQQVEELVDANFPPGYRFVPTDEELVEYYLENIVLGRRLPPNRIYVVYLYDYHPKELTGMYREHCENVWYFFTPRNRKYRNGKRPDRAAGNGYWKATNVEKEVLKSGPDDQEKPNKNRIKIILGFKRTLDYYEGKHPEGKRTDWKMNEYRTSSTSDLPIISDGKELIKEMVLCKIYRNSRAKNDNEEEVVGGLGGHDPSGPPASGDFSSNQNNSNSTVNITNALPNNSNGENIKQLDNNDQVAGGLGANQSARTKTSGESYSTQNNSNSTVNFTTNSIDEVHNDCPTGDAYLHPINYFRSEITTSSFSSNSSFIPSSSSVAMHYTEGTSGMEMGLNSIRGLFSSDEIKYLLDSFEN